MTKTMLKAYLAENGREYCKDYTIEDLDPQGGVVLFSHVSPCRNYIEAEKIDLLDILAWVFSNTSEVPNE